jgi:energy-coupling factor transport system ATP-binding protein
VFTASVSDLSFQYPRKSERALDKVGLNVAPGEITAIVGANGAGKSTLARCSVGLLPTSPGHVFLEGTDITRLKSDEIARRVGYVFQYPEHQFVGRSVLDDVAFGLRRAGGSAAEADHVAHQLLEDFGLEKLAAAHPYALSHGEQRRLSVAAMLALGQHGLFLDEPTFGQDRRNAYLLFEKFTTLAASGRAITAITHDMRLVAEIAARAVVMAAGQVLFDGPPSTLFADPSLLHSAGLLPPPIAQLGQLIGLPTPILSVDELARCLIRTEMVVR